MTLKTRITLDCHCFFPCARRCIISVLKQFFFFFALFFQVVTRHNGCRMWIQSEEDLHGANCSGDIWYRLKELHHLKSQEIKCTTWLSVNVAQEEFHWCREEVVHWLLKPQHQQPVGAVWLENSSGSANLMTLCQLCVFLTKNADELTLVC